MVNDINFFQDKNFLFFKKIHSKQGLDFNNSFDGYFIDADEKETRKIVDFLKNSKKIFKLAIKARDETFNRRVLETMNFDYLVSPEINLGKESLKQRSSGLNHVLAKAAAKKNISILISLDSLFRSDKKVQVILMERIIQNIKICRKAKCSVKIANFSWNQRVLSDLERKRIAESWMMSSQEIQSSCKF